MRIFWFLFSWVVAPLLRRRAVLRAIAEHDAYAHERVHLRKRPGFDPDQRLAAILQRAQRDLHRARVKVKRHHVQKILENN